MARFRTLTAGALLAFLLGAGIQTALASGGSLYSLLGYGDLRPQANARSAGMGFTGIGLSDSLYINPLSPATWGLVDRTRFEAAMLYEGFRSTDGLTSRYLARLDFTGIMLALPISPASGITFVGGFLPYSDVNYDVYTGGSYADPLSSIDYSVHQSGHGGLNKGTAGLSWAPMHNLSVGASLDYLFGTITTSRGLTVNDASLAGGTTNTEEDLSGVIYTFGLWSHDFSWVSESLRPLSIGLVASTRGIIHTRMQQFYVFTSETDTSAQTRGHSVVPLAYGIGAGYRLGNRLTLAADYAAQPWSNSTFNGVTPDNIRNSHRFGIGAELIPEKEQGAPWLQRIVYRAGFSYNQTYFLLNNQGINEWLVTAGMDIPIGYQQRLVVAAEYGGRGTTTDRLVKDNIFRISFSLNISEPWFIRYEED